MFWEQNLVFLFCIILGSLLSTFGEFWYLCQWAILAAYYPPSASQSCCQLKVNNPDLGLFCYPKASLKNQASSGI